MTEGFSQSESSFDLIASMPTTAQIYRCSEGLLAKCLEAKPTPECVAIVRKNYRDWQPLVSGGATPLWVGIDQGENADNLGMLLRSAEAAGVDGVLLAGGTVDAWGRRVVRAARGAMFSLRMSTHNSTLEAVEIAQSAGVQVISTSAKATETYTEVDYCLPTMILVGNEHHGIEEAVVERSDRCVYIPMLGHIHSLNIAVAASLMLYEAQRQRGWISPKSTLQKSVSPP